MTMTGPVVHQQLMDAYADAQRRLKETRGRIGEEMGQREEMAQERSDALLSLAQHYLPELTQEAVDQTWHDAREQLSKILVRKQTRQAELTTALREQIGLRQQQERRLVELNESLDECITRREQVMDSIEKRLREDDAFIRLSDRAALAEAALERAEANLSEIDQDSARKLPAYDDSALFRYLYDGGFGTSNYQKRGLTRRIDRWVAKLIDFRDARQGYEFLKHTPNRMRQIIAEDRIALDTVMQELERRRDELAEELGLQPMIEQVRQFRKQRDDCVDALEEIRVETGRLENELTALEDSRGGYYQDAIILFRDLLAQTGTKDLKRRARSTADVADDEIVAWLAGMDADEKGLAKAAKKRQQEIARDQEFLDELGRLIQRFRAARFDSARSQFADRLDIADDMERARDSGDMNFLWNRIRRAHRWGPTTMEKVGGIVSHPMTQMLVTAMAQVAASALRGHARRAGQRHADSGRKRNNKSKGKKGEWSDWGGDSSGDGFSNKSWF